MPTIVILSTQRTGSHHLAALLAANGVPSLYEVFNAGLPTMALWLANKVCEKNNTDEYAVAIKKVAASMRAPNGWLNVKIHLGQMKAISRTANVPMYQTPAFLERCFGTCYYVVIWRRDMVARTASIIEAEDTNCWSSRDTGAVLSTLPQYDYERTRRKMLAAEAWSPWTYLYNPIVVCYEDLLAWPLETLQKICDPLGIPVKKTEETHFKKQTTATKTQWIERFKAEWKSR